MGDTWCCVVCYFVGTVCHSDKDSKRLKAESENNSRRIIGLAVNELLILWGRLPCAVRKL